MNKLNTDIEAQLIKEQLELSERVEVRPLGNIRYIAGLDTAYWSQDGEERCCCVCVLYDMVANEIIEKVSSNGKPNFPYISGFLAYREAYIGIETAKKLKQKPDLIMIDGNGMLHPRKAGEAVKIGVELGIPAIGVAKKYCKISNVEFEMPENKKGAYTDICIEEDILGSALRTRENVRPAFVSIGNKITLEDARKVVLQLTTKDSYVPIPTRQADLETHILRKMLMLGKL